MVTRLEGISMLISAAKQFGMLPNQADIDQRNRIVSNLQALTGQDSTTLIAYLHRHAAERPERAIDTWLGLMWDMQTGVLDINTIDWSA